MGRLFGTDGARGVAVTELTCERAMEIGRAAAYVLTKESGKAHPNILLRYWRLRFLRVSLPSALMRCSWAWCLLRQSLTW